MWQWHYIEYEWRFLIPNKFENTCLFFVFLHILIQVFSFSYVCLLNIYIHSCMSYSRRGRHARAHTHIMRIYAHLPEPRIYKYDLLLFLILWSLSENVVYPIQVPCPFSNEFLYVILGTQLDWFSQIVSLSCEKNSDAVDCKCICTIYMYRSGWLSC